MHTIQPQDHTLYINGRDVPIVIPGDMDFKLYNMRVLHFQAHTVYLHKELMGVLTNHVWAEACLDVDLGYEPYIPGSDVEPEHRYNRFEGLIGISSYEEKGISQGMLVLRHVHFILHLR
ncbi:MAG TPA: hypothetical protein VGN87_06260 [Paenibacillus sp.]